LLGAIRALSGIHPAPVVLFVSYGLGPRLLSQVRPPARPGRADADLRSAIGMLRRERRGIAGSFESALVLLLDLGSVALLSA
jgi:hypothetical protein